MMSLYLSTFSLRFCAHYLISPYVSQTANRHRDISTSRVQGAELTPRWAPRLYWSSFEPMLVSEGLFAVANIFSFARIIYLFQVTEAAARCSMH